MGFSVQSEGNGQLFQIDLSTGAATPIGPVGFAGVESLAFGPNGTLFGVDTDRNILISVNPATGQGTAIHPLTSRGAVLDVASTGLKFASDGTLFLTTHNAGSTSFSLYSVNPATGIATFVGSLAGNVADVAGAQDGTLCALGALPTNALAPSTPPSPTAH